MKAKKSSLFDIIAFDADDTLWHNESLYFRTGEKYKEIVMRYSVKEDVDEKLLQTEMRNLDLYGYGIKSYVLSMIENAVDLTAGKITANHILEIIGLAKEMLSSSMELLPYVEETVTRLAGSYDLMIITKGDLLDQETKLARSGLTEYFRYFEILSEKSSASYQALFTRRAINPARFLMVGNSLRSDILPVIEMGGKAVYIPYHITWAHEAVANAAPLKDDYWELAQIAELPALLESLEAGQ